ncbi:MAG: agmatinase [Acidobacteria bacterium]|nr:agmatinase [Acidobacteriota bacterium]
MKLSLLGIPWDENSSHLRGAAGAPPAIRQALRAPSSNLSCENGLDYQSLDIEDAGDLPPTPGGAEMVQRIEQAVGSEIERGRRVISLGGDHAVTYPILRAYARHFSDLSILHIDAHSDLYDHFDGNRLSHASPFARILEEGLVKRLVQVGIRTMTNYLREQVARFGVEVFEMKDWRDDQHLDFDSPVYLSFDLDGLDPAFAPGVSHPEPGGLTTRQALSLIQQSNGTIVGADIVEYNPTLDPAGITAMVAAKLLKEIAAKMSETDLLPH